MTIGFFVGFEQADHRLGVGPAGALAALAAARRCGRGRAPPARRLAASAAALPGAPPRRRRALPAAPLAAAGLLVGAHERCDCERAHDACKATHLFLRCGARGTRVFRARYLSTGGLNARDTLRSAAAVKDGTPRATPQPEKQRNAMADGPCRFSELASCMYTLAILRRRRPLIRHSAHASLPDTRARPERSGLVKNANQPVRAPTLKQTAKHRRDHSTRILDRRNRIIATLQETRQRGSNGSITAAAAGTAALRGRRSTRALQNKQQRKASTSTSPPGSSPTTTIHEDVDDVDDTSASDEVLHHSKHNELLTGHVSTEESRVGCGAVRRGLLVA